MLYKQMQSILPMSEFDCKKETNHEFLIRLHAYKVGKKVEAVEHRNQVTISWSLKCDLCIVAQQHWCVQLHMCHHTEEINSCNFS